MNINDGLCFFRKHGNSAIFEKPKKDCINYYDNHDILIKKSCNGNCGQHHDCDCKDKNKIVNLNILSNWSKAQNLIQVNLNRILKVYRSDDYDEFVKNLIQVPRINSKDNFYLYVIKTSFRKPYKSIIVFHPCLPTGKSLKEIDYKNNNNTVGKGYSQLIEKMAENRKPLDLKYVSYEWNNRKKNTVAVLYKPLKSHNKFDDNAPYYIIACDFDL